MSNLKSQSPIVSAIYDAWKTRGDAEPERTYLGASILGHACDRYLWLAFRGALPRAFDGRMYRLFNRGQREEAVFTEDLRAIGCQVWEVDPETGRQFAVTFADGHGGGHLDGVATGVPGAPKTPHVVEYKTHSDSSFRKLEKQGVAVAKPMHFAQMQTYMGEMGLTRALYLAVNKDTDELYAERVEFDKAAYETLMRKAERLIAANEARAMTDRLDDFRCATCPAKALCHKTFATLADAPVTCRTCAHWTAEKGGACSCALGRTPEKPCDHHVFLPAFVRATPVDGTKTSVTYDLDGHRFANGPGAYSSAELVRLVPSDLDAVDLVKDACPGAHVVSVTPSLRERFDAELARNEGAPDFAGTQAEFAVQWPDATNWTVTEKKTDGGATYFAFDCGALGRLKDGEFVLVNAIPF